MNRFKPFTTNLMGSLPRTERVQEARHRYNRHELTQEEYDQVIFDETKKLVEFQEAAGIDVITSGEQDRDNYISFVAESVEGISMMSTDEVMAITSTEDQDAFLESLQERDAADNSMNTPIATGKIQVNSSFVLPEMQQLRQMTDRPLKATVPSPYLLTRNLWVKEVTGNFYANRKELAQDVVALVRQEVRKLIDFGVEVIQLDEPILSEVCFTADEASRSFY